MKCYYDLDKKLVGPESESLLINLCTTCYEACTQEGIRLTEATDAYTNECENCPFIEGSDNENESGSPEEN